MELTTNCVPVQCSGTVSVLQSWNLTGLWYWDDVLGDVYFTDCTTMGTRVGHLWYEADTYLNTASPIRYAATSSAMQYNAHPNSVSLNIYYINQI